MVVVFNFLVWIFDFAEYSYYDSLPDLYDRMVLDVSF